MPPTKVADRLLSWASDVEQGTIDQAAKVARLPFIDGHVALMPDAHVGMGATIGSVIPTKGAIIPSAVGVDIGCGMIAVETALNAEQLPDDLGELHANIARSVPAGVGQGHATPRTSSGRSPTRRATTSSRSASTSARACGWFCIRGREASAISWPRLTSTVPRS